MGEIENDVWVQMQKFPEGTIFHSHPSGNGYISDHPNMTARWIMSDGMMTPCEPYKHPNTVNPKGQADETPKTVSTE